MTKQHRAELKALEARMKYREFLWEVMYSMDDDVDDAEGEALAERLRSKNPQHFKVAKFHAGAVLHLDEADAKEAGEEFDSPESPDELRHLAAESLAFAWGFAEELGNDHLVEEVLKDAKRNGEVYEAVKAQLKGVREHLATMRRIDELEARAGGRG